MDNKFRDELQKSFPSLELTCFEEIVKKIALVPQVRKGNRLDFTDYEEISLINSKNENGVLIPNDAIKASSPANADLIHQYALQRGDLLLSYRAKNHIKVLRVKETPKRAMVGNTTTVRVEFKKEDLDALPSLIQAYLQLDSVQEYLIAKAIEYKESNDTKRFLISPTILKELPVPLFTTNSDVEFEDIMMQRTHLSALSKSVLHQMKELSTQSNRLLQRTLPSYINAPEELKQTSFRDKDVIDQLVRLQVYLEDMNLVLGEYFKNEVL